MGWMTRSLRNLSERLVYLRELDARRASIVESINGQGKMTDELSLKLARATTKAELEDLYLPYKPKRRTKAEIARERGLGPLADALWPIARPIRQSSRKAISPPRWRM